MIDKNNLTVPQLVELRKQIVLGSLFTKDFENDLDIDARDCQNFFDGYLDFINELMEEDDVDISSFWDVIDCYDNKFTLEEYYCMCEYPFGV